MVCLSRFGGTKVKQRDEQNYQKDLMKEKKQHEQGVNIKKRKHIKQVSYDITWYLDAK